MYSTNGSLQISKTGNEFERLRAKWWFLILQVVADLSQDFLSKSITYSIFIWKTCFVLLALWTSEFSVHYSLMTILLCLRAFLVAVVMGCPASDVFPSCNNVADHADGHAIFTEPQLISIGRNPHLKARLRLINQTNPDQYKWTESIYSVTTWKEQELNFRLKNSSGSTP